MTQNNASSGRAKKIAYWISTIWLSLGMVSTGAVQLMKAKAGTGGLESMIHLGYPEYFLTILGAWKIVGAVAVLAPGLGLIKEWAYAGFFFVMSGAIFSHVALKDPVTEILPSVLLLTLTILSWYTRPATRRLVPISQ